MKKDLLLTVMGLLCLCTSLYAQPNIFNPNDPATIYNPFSPPQIPPPNTLAKWVRTARSDTYFNTEKFKPYYFNGMAFRLRFPNGYNPADPNKKYPVILFFHGVGEGAGIMDNELQLFWGASTFEQKINSGQFDAFLLFPQSPSGWGYGNFLNINSVLDLLQQYCNADIDRVSSMGLSMGGDGTIMYMQSFPQRTAVCISSSPASIPYFNSFDPTPFIHVPIWISTGGTDGYAPPALVQTFVNNITNKGGDIRWSYYPTLGHGTWGEQWAEPYLIPYWNNAHKANPLVFYKQTDFPANTVINAKLGITQGFAEYQWQKDNVDIPGATSNEIIATQTGSYRVRFKRYLSSIWSDWSPNPINITRSGISSDNIPPSNPGNLRAVSAHRNFINLDWDNSTDNVGIAAYDVYVDGVKKYTTNASAITAGNLAANTSYTFTVKALDPAGNVSGASNAIVATTTATANGLNYRYYEGSSWNVLPDFNTLTPLRTGSSPNVDINVRPAGVNDNFAFVWEGYINITTPGTYTFETISDDGSKFYFNTLYSVLSSALANNDGAHGVLSASGIVNVPAPGLYPVAITYFEKGGGETMQVFWSGPGIARQLIPNSAFSEISVPDNTAPGAPTNLKVMSASSNSINLDWDNSTDNVGVSGYDVYVNGVQKYSTTVSDISADGLLANTSYSFTVKARDLAGNISPFSNTATGTTLNANTVNGLNYRYYEGAWNTLPNFNSLTAVKTGSTPNIDLSVRTPGVNDNFGFVWEGSINMPAAGTYIFETISDDGSKLYFNSLYSPSATALVNNDGLHPAKSATGTVNVAGAGLYPISITFFEQGGGESMQVYWSGPGISRQLIPNSAFTNSGTPPPPPPPSSAGLNYKYYEGTWSALPNFNSLSPVKTGSTPNIDITVRTPGRNDNFAFLWEGYITVPTAGNYTFEILSDDGSRLYFNSLYSPTAAALVNNDGIHGPWTPATGTVNIPTAAVYPIAITYFEAVSGESIQVFWSGPGIPRQLIPNSAFTTSGTPPPPSAGLNYKYYEGTWSALPNFNSLTPVKTGSSPNVDIGVRTPGRNDNFAFLWEGYINIPTAGSYTFETLSDDGSRVYFNSLYSPSATALVNNDGIHGPWTPATGTVNVPAAGLYPIAITFFEAVSGESMQVFWSGPGIPRQLIPNSAFMQTNLPPLMESSITANLNQRQGLQDAMEGPRVPVITAAYPNPFDYSFNISFLNTASANKIDVSISDLAGRLLYRRNFGNIAPGNSILKIDAGGKKLAAGLYLVTLTVNGIPSKMLKLVKR